jgi:hypothetical protein
MLEQEQPRAGIRDRPLWESRWRSLAKAALRDTLRDCGASGSGGIRFSKPLVHPN